MSQKVNTVKFDIDEQGRFCDGSLSFKNGKIQKSIGSNFTGEYSLENISEVCIIFGVGCGCLEMKKKGCDFDGNVVICRFSMTYVNEISEFNKMLNNFLQTGKEYEVVFEKRICEKCGRPFDPETNECYFCTKSSAVFSRTLKMFKSYFYSILKISLILILATGMTIITPIVQGNLIDKYFYNLDAISYNEAVKGIIFAIVLLILIYIVGVFFNSLASILAAKTGCAFSHELRYKLFDKIEKMSIASVSKHTTGELIHRITRDVDNVMNFFVGDAGRLLEKIVTFAVVLTILFITSSKLTVLVLLPIPVVIFLFSRTTAKMHKNNALLWRTGAKESSVLNDIIRGIRVVKTFGNEEKEIEKYSKASGNFCKMSIINGRFWAFFVEPVSFIISLGEIAVLIVGGKMVLDGKLTLGAFVSFNLYLTYIYSPLKWMSGLPRRVSQAVTSLVKIFDILDEKIDVCDNENSITEIKKGDIDFENVTFGYKSYEPVLKNINLKIHEGEMIGLVGHSGAGKSTMINLIIRLFDPNEGKILLGGTSLADYDQQSFRKKIGVVYQDTYLFAGTILDNIKYSEEDATLEQVINASKIANAHNFIMSFPDGYNTIIGENGHRLSGGERQRIAIARAVLRDPDILILDEATSALDPETEELIQQALGRLVKGRTTISIAHRLSTLRHADRLCVIENGEIAELGTHVELLKQKGIYYNLVMAQKQMTVKKK